MCAPSEDDLRIAGNLRHALLRARTHRSNQTWMRDGEIGDTLYRRFRDEVGQYSVRRAEHFGLTCHDGWDAAQEAWVRVFTTAPLTLLVARDSYGTSATDLGWFLQRVRLCCLSALRNMLSRKRKERTASDVGEEIVSTFELVPDRELKTIGEERAYLLRELIHNLMDPETGDFIDEFIFIQRILSGLNPSEAFAIIADQKHQGKSDHAIRALQQRMCQRIRKIARKHLPED